MCTLNAELNIGYVATALASAVIGSPLCMCQTGSGEVFSLHGLKQAVCFLDIEYALVVQGKGDYRNQGERQHNRQQNETALCVIVVFSVAHGTSLQAPSRMSGVCSYSVSDDTSSRAWGHFVL
jgi:hypothetical protein